MRGSRGIYQIVEYLRGWSYTSPWFQSLARHQRQEDTNAWLARSGDEQPARNRKYVGNLRKRPERYPPNNIINDHIISYKVGPPRKLEGWVEAAVSLWRPDRTGGEADCDWCCSWESAGTSLSVVVRRAVQETVAAHRRGWAAQVSSGTSLPSRSVFAFAQAAHAGRCEGCCSCVQGPGLQRPSHCIDNHAAEAQFSKWSMAGSAATSPAQPGVCDKAAAANDASMQFGF